MGAQDLQVSEVLPLLYLHGLSSGDFVPALSQFLGTSAGLSGPVITKLTEHMIGPRQGYRTVRADLGDQIPPHAIDGVLTAYRTEGNRTAATAQAVDLVERALLRALRNSGR